MEARSLAAETSDEMPERKRLQAARLYLITGLAPARMDLLEMVSRALDGGVDVVQLREKAAEAAPLLRALAELRRLTEARGALLIVNDRLDLGLASGADGVHLGQKDLPVQAAREQAGPDILIGLSTHSEREFRGAPHQADYLGVGPVFSTPTKPGRPPVGSDLVRFAAAQEAEKPFFAIGGIDLDTLPSVIDAGAARVAVLRAIADSDEPDVVARKMRKMLDSAPRRRGVIA